MKDEGATKKTLVELAVEGDMNLLFMQLKALATMTITTVFHATDLANAYHDIKGKEVPEEFVEILRELARMGAGLNLLIGKWKEAKKKMMEADERESKGSRVG